MTLNILAKFHASTICLSVFLAGGGIRPPQYYSSQKSPVRLWLIDIFDTFQVILLILVILVI